MDSKKSSVKNNCNSYQDLIVIDQIFYFLLILSWSCRQCVVGIEISIIVGPFEVKQILKRISCIHEPGEFFCIIFFHFFNANPERSQKSHNFHQKCSCFKSRGGAYSKNFKFFTPSILCIMYVFTSDFSIIN